ncbi:MFS transporter [Catellatospora sp. IY07-71]|uniref:MFS transporter n=1 Tax=Catellatospora sp. IY07-71 TaxID=2728827 RepID=UPI001BB43635|nr:MFS transporter [Catellatospora sp. IY07-71]BCJ75251.1 MFS transporter [Catellatospora sp. IY07-71]
MYITLRRDTPAPGRRALSAVPANVIALGAVSLVTDVSSEMVTAVLPLYLALTLGLTPLQLGFVDALSFGATALLRPAGARVADRWRHKPVAAAGYALSALAKLGVLAAGAALGPLAAAIVADRTGKGLRTAPRDALIAASAPAGGEGLAFGVHRAMDTVGALLGPLAAFAVLAATGGTYRAVFVVSFCVAAFGVVLLALYVRDRPGPTPPAPPLRTVLRDRRLWRMCAVAAGLGAFTMSDFFVYLLLQRSGAVPLRYFPLLPLGTAAVYLLLAVPLGRLADRVGRARVLLGGHLALVAATLLLAGTPAAAPMVVGVLLLHGLFYASTDGVLMALAGPLLRDSSRTTGLAMVQTAQAAARFVSSLAAGALWAAWGPRAALLVMAAGLLAAVLAAARGLR